MDEIRIRKHFPPRAKKRSYKKALGLLIILLLIGVAGFFLIRYFNSREISNDDIIRRVSKIYNLPEGENPTIATVTDLYKLGAREFFRDAKNGDKVLIYRRADKVILYRPFEGKIINVDEFITSGIETP